MKRLHIRFCQVLSKVSRMKLRFFASVLFTSLAMTVMDKADANLDDEFVYSVSLGSTQNSILVSDAFWSDSSREGFFFGPRISGSPRGFSSTSYFFDEGVLRQVSNSLYPNLRSFSNHEEQISWVRKVSEEIVDKASKKYKKTYQSDWNECDDEISCTATLNFVGPVKTMSLKYSIQKFSAKLLCDKSDLGFSNIKSYMYSYITISYTSTDPESPQPRQAQAIVNKFYQPRGECLDLGSVGTVDSARSIWKLQPNVYVKTVRLQ